jgi:hypothetical protein
MNICPVTCQIVKEAIRAHEEWGASMIEYIERQKDDNGYCQMCDRNDKSTLPSFLKRDNGRYSDE